MRVIVVTHSVSPYQAELFNAIVSSARVHLRVIYLQRRDPARRWTVPPLFHSAGCLEDDTVWLDVAHNDILDADIAVFNYYAERRALELLDIRAASGKPWCFWGERPGFRKPEWIGRLVRRRYLSRLHNTSAPIWGIGRFAVERYQMEFGLNRPYCNLPYFSDLDRFQPIRKPRRRAGTDRVFLFSGSLTHRKGVDLVGRVFARLAREFSHVRLKILGAGELAGTVACALEAVRDRVEFLGFKDWQELPEQYATADILCVPSRYDGWGLVVPEGLASGLPVIGTAQMGAAIEFIETGSNGWLLPAGDETALLAALREAALLPNAKLAEMSRRARQSVSEHSLNDGVERFIRATGDALANWQN